MKYYLGLDNGGTATKAAVFDENGREVAVAGMDTAMLVPKPGFTERDMEEMWEANCQVIRRAMEKAGVTPQQTAMLGDKLLTDVLGANRSGVLAVMVEPMGGPKGAWNHILHGLQKPFKARCKERK